LCRGLPALPGTEFRLAAATPTAAVAVAVPTSCNTVTLRVFAQNSIGERLVETRTAGSEVFRDGFRLATKSQLA